MKNKKSKTRFVVLLMASYINNFGWAIYSPLYALYVVRLGGTAFDASILWGFYAFTTGFLMMLFGKLEDKSLYNPTKMLVLGYGLFIAVAIGLFTIDTVKAFYGVQLLLAVAMGIMTPASRITFARAQIKGKEAGEWGLFDGGNYLLIALASIAGGFLYKLGGFETIFSMMILVQTISTLLALQHYQLSRKR